MIMAEMAAFDNLAAFHRLATVATGRFSFAARVIRFTRPTGCGRMMSETVRTERTQLAWIEA